MPDIAPAEQVFAQLIRLLVRYPERVTSYMVSNDLGQTIRIQVDTEDLGKVIGKHGQTARSLRILLSAIGANAGSRFMLDISENPDTVPESEDSMRQKILV